MNSTLDQAKAFTLIAEHLDDDERSRIASAIATRIERNLGATKRRTGTADDAGATPDVDPNHIEGQTAVGAYLAGKGLTGIGLVRATAQITPMLAREWISRYGTDEKQPTGYVPNDAIDVLDRVYERWLEASAPL